MEETRDIFFETAVTRCNTQTQTCSSLPVYPLWASDVSLSSFRSRPLHSSRCLEALSPKEERHRAVLRRVFCIIFCLVLCEHSVFALFSSMLIPTHAKQHVQGEKQGPNFKTRNILAHHSFSGRFSPEQKRQTST